MKSLLTEEEKRVDEKLGFPPGYAKLCRNAHSQLRGLITPFTDGPPQCYLPYPLTPDDNEKVKELNELFPVIESDERDASNARRYADLLWKQLDHLGRAGFDPEKFRIDPYGNVIYRFADPASPLAWEVDHWFPHSRGGKTVPSNLRLVQSQGNQRKQNKLEFLVPWWDLQLGISVNQFLSVFASKNSDFRYRAFSLFFKGGAHELVGEAMTVDCHLWPHHFLEIRSQLGFAPAAIVSVQKPAQELFKFSSEKRLAKPSTCLVAISDTPARKRRWTTEEEEALRHGVQIFGPGNWKEIKEHEPLLQNRSTVQIKDKYRQMKGEWEVEKENQNTNLLDKEIVLSRTVQKEHRLQKLREQEIHMRQEEIFQLEKQLKDLQLFNEAERLAIEDMESLLTKQKRKVEKQRKWSEAQSSYKSCLEKMIRDAMHQTVMYKEQGRLTQAACSTLMAMLETQKATCDAAEMDLIKKLKHREELESLLQPYLEQVKKNAGNNDDVLECSKALVKLNLQDLPNSACLDAKLEASNVKKENATIDNKASIYSLVEATNKHCNIEVAEAKNVQPLAAVRPSKQTRKEVPKFSETTASELDVYVVGYEYEGDKVKARAAESVGENLTMGTMSENTAIFAKEDCVSMVGGMITNGPYEAIRNAELRKMHEDGIIKQELPLCMPNWIANKETNCTEVPDSATFINGGCREKLPGMASKVKIEIENAEKDNLQSKSPTYVCCNEAKLESTRTSEKDNLEENIPNLIEGTSECMGEPKLNVDIKFSDIKGSSVPNTSRISNFMFMPKEQEVGSTEITVLKRCEDDIKSKGYLHSRRSSDESRGKTQELFLRTGEEPQQSMMMIRNGLAASIKTCANVFKKAVKKMEG